LSTGVEVGVTAGVGVLGGSIVAPEVTIAKLGSAESAGAGVGAAAALESTTMGVPEALAFAATEDCTGAAELTAGAAEDSGAAEVEAAGLSDPAPLLMQAKLIALTLAGLRTGASSFQSMSTYGQQTRPSLIVTISPATYTFMDLTGAPTFFPSLTSWKYEPVNAPLQPMAINSQVGSAISSQVTMALDPSKDAT
jgi:hypothetical protein